MSTDFASMHRPTELVQRRAYYLTIQKARYTCWIYLGTASAGEWFKNRGTGADWFVKSLSEVREVPREDYKPLHLPNDGYITEEEVATIKLISEYNKKTHSRVSQKSIADGFITIEDMRKELYCNVESMVLDNTKSYEVYPTEESNSSNSSIETPAQVEEVYDWKDCNNETEPTITLEEAKQIIATIPSMADKMYLLYPELVPVVPAIWEVITADVYKYSPENLSARVINYGNKSPIELDDTYVGSQPFLSTMNAIRKLSFLRQRLGKIEISEDEPFYTIVVSSDTSTIEVLPTYDVASPFIFATEKQGEEFLVNNSQLVNEYFSFITETFH